MASLIGNPQDVLSTPYGYSGQFSPETAVQEQALNRRRLLANMLTQQGMQQPQGQMAGRFYVAPSPLQHGANLASMLAGVLTGNYIDKKQGELAKADREAYQAAIRGYLDKTNPQAQPMAAPQPQAETGQALPPAPEGPYTGQVGAVPMPEPGVQSDKPPIEAMRPQSQAGIEGMKGLDMENVQPADMSQAAGQAPPPGMEPPPPMPEPAPPMPQAAPPVDKRRALIELRMHQHPMVQRFAAMEMQRLDREDDRGSQREFMANENALNRDVRREGILENSRMREAQMQNTMALTQMQIDAKMQAGHDANDLKASLAKQAADLQKLQIQTSAELKKAEMGSRADIAKQHDETLKTIAGMKAGSKEDTKIAEQEKSKKDVEGIIAVLRDSYNQLKAGGGVTDVSRGSLQNMGAAASSSGVGQALGKTFGTQNQSHRNTIAQQRPILMGNISKALGMSAKQLDSNAELKLWLNAATDPTLDYQTNMRALDQLESMLAGGGAGPRPSAPAVGGAVVNSLPQGAKQIGTSGGKPVYQTPDGKKFIGE